MKTLVRLLLILMLLPGCGGKGDIDMSSSATFDAKGNAGLKGQVASLGSLDKTITVEGVPKSLFLVTVGVSGERGSASGSSLAAILFKFELGKLLPFMDWKMSGGGERPALRRESDTEITVYYPTTIDKQRTWVKFKVVMKR